MAFILGSRSLEKVGIVGSGQIGPDIALHMTKVLEPEGVAVVVVDIAPQALEAGRAKLDRKVDKGVETKAFSSEQGAAMKSNVVFTEDYEALRDADLVIEAATEDLDLKKRIFAQVENLAAPDGVLASNSSHLEPERIFENSRAAERALVTHYFFPAERNPLVEVVPSDKTDGAIVEWLLAFYEAIGKVPIRVTSATAMRSICFRMSLFQGAELVFLPGELPDGEEVIDFYHAAGHLDTALAAAYGDTHPKRRAQFEKQRHVLLEDYKGVEKVIRSLVHLRDTYPRRKKIARELKYFRRNRHRMRYAALKEQGLPIGSGVTEAACKTLATQRMKRSGMRWGEQGGQAILSFRALVQSNRFERAWTLLAHTYKAEVTTLDNVVPIRSWQ